VDDAGDPLFPVSQAHHFWVKALRRLGHHCAVFWRSTGAGPWTRRSALHMSGRLTASRILNALAVAGPNLNPLVQRRNRALLASAARFEPHVVVLVGGNDVVLPATLAALRGRHGARIVYASGTSPVVFSHAIEREAAPLYDLVVVNDLYHAIQWRELGAARAEVLPLSAIDPEFHHPGGTTQDNGRVVFVGTLVPERLYGERIAALLALSDYPLDIWSVHAVPSSLAPFHRGAALGDEMIDVLRHAAIAINPHGNFMRFGGNMRLFEACGVGALQIVDDRPGVKEWFAVGDHLLAYRSSAHLQELAGECLNDAAERRRIGRAGCAHVHAHHTYEHRMRRLVDLIEQRHPA
jgi:hypothetical protein